MGVVLGVVLNPCQDRHWQIQMEVSSLSQWPYLSVCLSLSLSHTHTHILNLKQMKTTKSNSLKS